MTDFTNDSFKLTQREQSFIKKYLASNDCGAQTPEELLEDNYSCHDKESLSEEFPELSINQIGGFLSSLQTKNVLWIEERDRDIDLYWVGDEYLNSLNPDLNFY